MDVKDVAKVELFGIQNRTIEVTVNPSLLSQSGVMMADIASAFERQNKVVDAGAIETSTNRLRIEADGSFTSLEEIENLTVVSRKGEYFRLGEIAEIRKLFASGKKSDENRKYSSCRYCNFDSIRRECSRDGRACIPAN